MEKIGVIDYGMGNLKNVYKAFSFLGSEVQITQDCQILSQCDKLILPGVGAFEQAIQALKTSGLEEVIKKAVEKEKPLLGICLGMQLLFNKSYENGEHRGLGILPGEIIKLDVSLKVPHMGWNTLEITKREPLFQKVREENYVYFVHSYHLQSTEDIISSYTTYGKKIPVSVQKANVFGVQFHPEKSGETGLNILKAFIDL